MKKILLTIAFICVTVVVLSNLIGGGWIIYHEGSFRGKVIDEETKQPIEGAVVVAVYNVREYGFIESGQAAASAKEVLTNRDGEFYIPPNIFLHLSRGITGFKETTTFIIYKPGYAPSHGPHYVYRPDGFIVQPDTSMIVEAFRKGITLELTKSKTKEESIRNIPSPPDDMGAWRLPLLFKAINEDRKRFGFEETR